MSVQAGDTPRLFLGLSRSWTATSASGLGHAFRTLSSGCPHLASHPGTGEDSPLARSLERAWGQAEGRGLRSPVSGAWNSTHCRLHAGTGSHSWRLSSFQLERATRGWERGSGAGHVPSMLGVPSSILAPREARITRHCRSTQRGSCRPGRCEMLSQKRALRKWAAKTKETSIEGWLLGQWAYGDFHGSLGRGSLAGHWVNFTSASTDSPAPSA